MVLFSVLSQVPSPHKLMQDEVETKVINKLRISFNVIILTNVGVYNFLPMQRIHFLAIETIRDVETTTDCEANQIVPS